MTNSIYNRLYLLRNIISCICWSYEKCFFSFFFNKPFTCKHRKKSTYNQSILYHCGVLTLLVYWVWLVYLCVCMIVCLPDYHLLEISHWKCVYMHRFSLHTNTHTCTHTTNTTHFYSNTLEDPNQLTRHDGKGGGGGFPFAAPPPPAPPPPPPLPSDGPALHALPFSTLSWSPEGNFNIGAKRKFYKQFFGSQSAQRVILLNNIYSTNSSRGEF